jgi:hypothetical protein
MSEQDPKKIVKGVVDIVFLIDATASMSSCIEAVKNNINTFIDAVCDETKQDNPVKDWRAKVVGYRDFLDDAAAKPLEDNPFVHNAEALKTQLAALEPVGGGDEPESLFDAIIHLAEMDATEKGAQDSDPNKWRYLRSAARVIIIFTDAPCHPTTKEGGTFDDIANHCYNNRFCLNIFAPQYPCYDELVMIDKTEYESFEIQTGETGVQALEQLTSDPTYMRNVMRHLGASVT